LHINAKKIENKRVNTREGFDLNLSNKKIKNVEIKIKCVLETTIK
jgi:hypothetical protein